MQLPNTLVIAFLTATAAAQTATQNATAAALAAQIPACARSCDDAGIRQVGCSLDDYACHCAHGTQLSEIIPPCLKNSTCTPTDLQTFGAIPGKICAALNSTTASNTTDSGTSTATGSGSTSGSATATPSGPSSTGSGAAATSSSSAGVANVASALFAIAGTGLFAVFLG